MISKSVLAILVGCITSLLGVIWGMNQRRMSKHQKSIELKLEEKAKQEDVNRIIIDFDKMKNEVIYNNRNHYDEISKKINNQGSMIEKLFDKFEKFQEKDSKYKVDMESRVSKMEAKQYFFLDMMEKNELNKKAELKL